MKIEQIVYCFCIVSLSFCLSLRGDERTATNCPSLQGDYCCGITNGEIDRCTEPMHLEQNAIDGGQSYTFHKDDNHRTILADEKVRPMQFGKIMGDGTSECTKSGVYTEIPDAILKGTNAKGYYSKAYSLDASGWMTIKEVCVFSDNGVPVALDCSLGTGYGCQRK